MRKDDIIGQKLFETCKLSEFYLDLVVNAKPDDESPLLLARAYKQKLYEIVERYDRLLDTNRQRQQLSLAFESPQQQPQQKKVLSRKPPTTPLQTPTTSMATRTSTPNKLNLGGSQLQLNTSNQSSYASTPTTPCQPMSIKSSFSTYSISQSRNSTNNLNRQVTTPSRHSLYSFSKSHSITNNSKLSPYSHIYDDDDYDDDTQYSNENLFESSKPKLNYENLSNKTIDNNTTINYDDEMDETRTLDKSCSNLSKDSGVFGDSYHSEYSNCVIDLNTDSKNKEEENYLENLLTPSSSLSNPEHEYDEQQDEDKKVEEQDGGDGEDEEEEESEDEVDSTKQTSSPSSKTQFIWGTVSRLVETSFSNLAKKNTNNKREK